MEGGTIKLSERATRIGVAFLIVHFLFVGAYVLPENHVPTIVQHWSKVWVRPLFHQQWKLFAPDPPMCSCELQVEEQDDQRMVTLRDAKAHFLWKRSVDGICRWQVGTQKSDRPVLVQAMGKVSKYAGHRSEQQLRSIQRCVDDPAVPTERSRRAINLRSTRAGS